MSVPTNSKLHQVAGLIDHVGNFGSWPPTEAYRDAFKAQGVLFNLRDTDLDTPAKLAAQIEGARSHDVWAGVWHPVPAAGIDGAKLAFWIHDRIRFADAELQAHGGPKIDVAWLNFEGFTVAQWRAFLWGKANPVAPGWRGSAGVRGSTNGYRPGFSSGSIDQPYQDGTVCPHSELIEARFMRAEEGFYGPTSEWPDMTPADHPAAIVDRILGKRSDGSTHTTEAYPPEQVVGCYDAALGSVVDPAEPLLIRAGLHFTLERARQAGII